MPDSREETERQIEPAAQAALQAWLTVALADIATPTTIDPTRVLATARLWVEQVTDEIMPIVRDTWRTRFIDITGRPPSSSLIDAYMTAARNRMVRVPDEVAARIHEIVARNVGTNLQDMATLIHAELDYTGTANWPNRAMVIARTESGGAWNGSQTAAYRADAERLRVDLYKSWLAADDERTRPTHVAADGQTVPLDGEYIVGGFRMDYPLDPAGPAHEVINCRCAQRVGTRAELFRARTVLGLGDTMSTKAGRTIISSNTRDERFQAMSRQRWSGLLAPYGRPTGDGRMIEGNIDVRPLPLSFRWQPEDSEGHGGAVSVGRILAAGTRQEVVAAGFPDVPDQGAGIYGGGDLFDPSQYTGGSADAIVAAAAQMADGLGLVSVDLVDCDAEFVESGDDVQLIIHAGTLAGSTLVGIPAFAEARVELERQAAAAAGGLVKLSGKGRTRLLELSMTFSADAAALSVEDDPTRLYAVTGSTSLPIGPDRSWDGPRAAGRMLDAALGEGGTINVRTASRGFFWHDDDGSKRGDYKLPFADLVDGSLQVIPSGVRAVLGRLDSTDIPDSAKSTIRGKAERLLERANRSQDQAAREAAELADDTDGEESPGEDESMAALDARMQAAELAALDARMGV